MEDKHLPSVNELICSEKNLETIDYLLESLKDKNLKSVEDYILQEEVEDVVEKYDDTLPSIDDFTEEIIEKVEKYIEEEIIEEDPIEDLKIIIEEVRNSIPKIPEFKSYDNEILELLHLIENVKNEIPEPPEIPEIKYYDEDISLLEERINFIKKEILNLPEVKYYDQEIESAELNILNLQEKVNNLPEVKYYDKDISELDFKVDNIADSIDRKIDNISEVIDIKFFESKVNANSIVNERINDLKQSLKKDIDLYEVKILDLKNNYIEDTKFFKKELKEVCEILDKNFIEKIEDLKKEYSSYNNKFDQYSEEIEKLNSLILNLPETKYYDKDLKKLDRNISSIEISFKNELKEIQSIVNDIKLDQIQLKEGLLNEPPEIQNKDPLTPLDKNFATLDDLQNHYRLFINRIQQQISTLGGGGETRLEFLDDVDRDSAKVNGRFLKYDAASDKWIGALGGGGGSQTLDDTLGLGNTSSLGMSVGVVTASYFVGDGSLLTNVPGSANSGYANTSGISTYATIAGISTYSAISGIATYAITAGISTYAASSGIATSARTIVSNEASILTGVTTTTTSSETPIDNFFASTYRSAKYMVQITEGTSYHATEIFVIHDGTTTYNTEYGTLKTNELLSTFDTDIDSGNVRLLATPTSASPTTFKIVRTLINS
jgi:hypothetical protein